MDAKKETDLSEASAWRHLLSAMENGGVTNDPGTAVQGDSSDPVHHLQAQRMVKTRRPRLLSLFYFIFFLPPSPDKCFCKDGSLGSLAAGASDLYFYYEYFYFLVIMG